MAKLRLVSDRGTRLESKPRRRYGRDTSKRLPPGALMIFLIAFTLVAAGFALACGCIWLGLYYMGVL